jgi:hypothetical protein
MDNFATFILTHGRADNVKTYSAIRKHGYTGKIYLLIDNEDKEIDRYHENYPGEVIVFDKTEYSKHIDTCDNYEKRNSIVFARNYNFIIAKEMGIKYFWQLDDDYLRFSWRFDNLKNFINSKSVKNLDKLLEASVKLLQKTKAKTVAFAQEGDFAPAGPGSVVAKVFSEKNWFSRKAMNSFIFDTDNPCEFRGRVNDDVNLYVECGRRGDLFITIPMVSLKQVDTQQAKGGCTDIYLELGTYIKSFYSVIVAPSCVKIRVLNTANRRMHHSVLWKYATPLILGEEHKK